MTHFMLSELSFVAIVIVIATLDVMSWIFIRRKAPKSPTVFFLIKLGCLSSYFVLGLAAYLVHLVNPEILLPSLGIAVIIVYYVMFIKFPEQTS